MIYKGYIINIIDTYFYTIYIYIYGSGYNYRVHDQHPPLTFHPQATKRHAENRFIKRNAIAAVRITLRAAHIAAS